MPATTPDLAVYSASAAVMADALLECGRLKSSDVSEWTTRERCLALYVRLRGD